MAACLALALLLQTDVDALIRDLGSDDLEVRGAAETKLLDAGRPALEKLRKAAAGTERDVAVRAGLLARRIELRATVPPALLKRRPDIDVYLARGWSFDAVHDADRDSPMQRRDFAWLVHHREVRALSPADKRALAQIAGERTIWSLLPEVAGLLNDLGADAGRAIHHLTRARCAEAVAALAPHLRSADRMTRREAARAILEIDPCELTPEQIDALRRCDDRDVRILAVSHLPEREATAALRSMLADADDAHSAAFALADRGDREAESALRKIVEDAHLRVEAAEKLAAFDRDAAVKMLSERLTGDESAFAAAALGRLRVESVVPDLAKLLPDRDAASALRAIGTKPAAAALRRFLSTDADFDLTVTALRAAAEADDRDAIAAMVAYFEKMPMEVAAEALGALRAEEVKLVVLRLLDHPVPNTRFLAIYAAPLVRATNAMPRLKEIYLAKESPARQKTMAAIALARLGDATAEAVLLQLASVEADTEALLALCCLREPALSARLATARVDRSLGPADLVTRLSVARTPCVRRVLESLAATIGARVVVSDAVPASLLHYRLARPLDSYTVVDACFELSAAYGDAFTLIFGAGDGGRPELHVLPFDDALERLRR